MATLDALRRQDYQLAKAQELAVGKKEAQLVAGRQGQVLSVKGYSHRPHPHPADQRGHLPSLVPLDQQAALSGHLNIQE